MEEGRTERKKMRRGGERNQGRQGRNENRKAERKDRSKGLTLFDRQ